MRRFEDNLWNSVLDECGDDLARTHMPSAREPRHRLRPRTLAGGTLGLAGIGVGLVLAFSGSTAAPAFAITTGSDGARIVHLDNIQAVGAAERQLSSMGISEWFEPVISPGPASSNAPVACTVPTAAQAAVASGATQRSASTVPADGPKIEVILGSDGNQVVPAGQAGAGTWHLSGCFLYSGTYPGTGSTGTGGTGTN